MELHDEEGAAPLPDHNPFGHEVIRHNFTMKVTNLVFVQFSVILASVTVTITLEDIVFECRDQIEESQFVMYVFLTAFFVYVFIALSVWVLPVFSRHRPVYLILFSVVTLCLAVVVSTACALFQFKAIMLSLMVLISSCAAFRSFSFNIEYNLRSWRGFLSCFIWPTLITAILLAVPISSSFIKINAGLMAAVYTFFLMFDIHRIMSRPPRIALSPEEYVTGALYISTDVVVIILFIPLFLCTAAILALSMLLDSDANATCDDAMQVCVLMCHRPARAENEGPEGPEPQSDSGIAV